MSTFTVHEAKTNLSKLIARVLAGEDVVIARGKEPVVRLVAVEDFAVPKRRLAGRFAGQGSVDDRFFEPLPDDELALWNGEGD